MNKSQEKDYIHSYLTVLSRIGSLSEQDKINLIDISNPSFELTHPRFVKIMKDLESRLSQDNQLRKEISNFLKKYKISRIRNIADIGTSFLRKLSNFFKKVPNLFRSKKSEEEQPLLTSTNDNPVERPAERPVVTFINGQNDDALLKLLLKPKYFHVFNKICEQEKIFEQESLENNISPEKIKLEEKIKLIGNPIFREKMETEPSSHYLKDYARFGITNGIEGITTFLGTTIKELGPKKQALKSRLEKISNSIDSNTKRKKSIEENFEQVEKELNSIDTEDDKYLKELVHDALDYGDLYLSYLKHGKLEDSLKQDNQGDQSQLARRNPRLWDSIIQSANKLESEANEKGDSRYPSENSGKCFVSALVQIDNIRKSSELEGLTNTLTSVAGDYQTIKTEITTETKTKGQIERDLKLQEDRTSALKALLGTTNEELVSDKKYLESRIDKTKEESVSAKTDLESPRGTQTKGQVESEQKLVQKMISKAQALKKSLKLLKKMTSALKESEEGLGSGAQSPQASQRQKQPYAIKK